MNYKISPIMLLLIFSIVIGSCVSREPNLSETPQVKIADIVETNEIDLPTATEHIEQITEQTIETTSTPQASPRVTEMVHDQQDITEDFGLRRTVLLKFNPEETSSIYMEVSPDGKQIAYKRFSEQGQSVIFDGNEYGPYDEVEFLDFSPDSQHLVFIATITDKSFAVLDGIEQQYYDLILASARFSPDSEHIIYEARQGKKTIAVIDYTEFTYDAINGPIYISPDSSSIAFVARNINAEHFVVQDGIEGKKYDEIEIYNLDLYFSADGGHLAYVAKEGGNWYVVLDEKESIPFSSSSVDITFSPDSQHFVYAAFTDDEKVLFIDGEQMNNYDDSFSPIFSPDSQHFAYEASLDDETFVVVDGIEGPKHDGYIYGFTFSPDGERYAYQVGTDDEYLLVIDGEIQGEKDVRRRPLFSPDSQHIAYQPYDSEFDIIVLDGDVNEKYDTIEYVTFSPDGNHLLIIVQEDDTWDDYVVFNGLPGEKFDEILPQIVFEMDDSFNYMAIKGDEVYLIEQTIK